MHPVSRRAVLALGVGAWFATAAVAESLPGAVNLQEDGRRAAAERQPIVLFFRPQGFFGRNVERT